MNTWRQILGYGLLTLSCVAWVLVPVVPFLDMPTSNKITYAGGLYLFSQVTWYTGLTFLGPEVVDLGRRGWQWCKTRLGFPQEELELTNSVDKHDADGLPRRKDEP